MSKPNLTRPTVAEQSAEALRGLERYLRSQTSSSPHVRLRLSSETNSQERQIAVPVEALALFAKVLEQLAQGHTVKLESESPELAAHEAAAVLNVPSSYYEQLLDDGALPYKRIGNERRVCLSDLLSYKHHDLLHRRRIAAELTAESQDLGLYD